MRRSLLPLLPLALALATAGCGAFDPELGYLSPPRDAGEGEIVSFAEEIRPLMNRANDDPDGHGCKSCHYPAQPYHVGYDLGGLDLSTLGGLRRGGATSGAKIVIAGDPDDSVLVQKLEGTYPFGGHMPRNGPPFWSAEDIGYVRDWIAAGAKGADDE